MWRDGIVVLDDGVIVAEPLMQLSKLQHTAIPTLELKVVASCADTIRAGIGPVSIDRSEWYLTAYFRSERMINVTLLLSETEVVHRFRSSDKKSEELLFYKAWINGKMGRSVPCTFPWGTVDVGTDHWTLDPYIFFGYSNSNRI